ncbi:MAG: hypothetical protein WC856_06580 [Methylococcaceae bacterium]|jgi:hypothetical protein
MTAYDSKPGRINEKLIYKCFRLILKIKAHKKLSFGKNLCILGCLPIIKAPRNGRIILGDHVVLNSDFINSNTSLTTRVKFVTGYNGIIKIGNNCDLNGTCMVAYEEIVIGNYCQFASSSLITDNDFHPIDHVSRIAQMKGDSFSFNKVQKKGLHWATMFG